MIEHYSTYQSLLVSQEARLLRLTLNRPDSLNGVGATMQAELSDFFYRVRSDSSVGAILLSGAGRAFSAGGDVNDMADAAADQLSPVQRVNGIMADAKTLFTNMLDVVQPIVCAVHGYAMGVAASIALSADIVVAADDAIIADTHVNIGLVTGDGGSVLWPLLLPLGTAKYYLMTGERITGVEAARLGLVLRAVPASEVLTNAEEIALRLANGPGQAIQGIKQSVNKVVRDRAALQLDTGLALEAASMLSEDHHEAIAAFSERRPPVFSS